MIFFLFFVQIRCTGAPFPAPLPGINDMPECMPDEPVKFFSKNKHYLIKLGN